MYVKSGGKFESSDWFLHSQDNLPHGPSLFYTDNHKTCKFFSWKPENSKSSGLFQVTLD